ncbi:diguanylate cyclase (GGDEF)-like protein [Modestobacter roseus]|uniref:Diguanylate cyclase (GGDEF)-like protein n=1 Tax=Modestobacter roseus TaxID=1181884 RepID=A0A562IUG1_9ACTN|nr:diguanylate cyclase (GGDEF)-like protein [Modestobacter roseus]
MDRPRRGERPAAEGVTLTGLGLLGAGVLLHVGLVAALGPDPENAGLQLVVLAAQLVACAAVYRWRSRLPARTWPTLTVLATPMLGVVPVYYPEAVLVAVPVLFLLVVFTAKLLGRGVARLVTAEAVGVGAWIASQLDGGIALLAVHVVFVGGVLLLVHVTLARAADEQDLLVARLAHAADVDGLTGLLSRRAFEAGLDDALQRSSAPCSLLLVDLDRFKSVNDGFGHPAGDAALRHVGGLVEAAVRRFGGLVGRLGGDELGVLLVGCAQPVALERAEELVRAVRTAPLVLPAGISLPLSISVGVATSDDGDRVALYAAADAALYAAKTSGRDQASGDQRHDRRTLPQAVPADAVP